MADPTNPFSDANLAKAVKPLADLPPNQVQVGVTATKDDYAAEVEGEKNWHNGAFVQGDGGISKKRGWFASVWFGIRGK